MSFVCISYFYPKKYTLTPKLKNSHFYIIQYFSADTKMYYMFIGLGVHISLTVALHTIALQCKKRSPSRSHRSRSTTLENRNQYIHIRANGLRIVSRISIVIKHLHINLIVFSFNIFFRSAIKKSAFGQVWYLKSVLII